VSIFARTPIVSGSVPLYQGKLVLPLDRNFLFKGKAKDEREVTRPNRSIAALPIRTEPGFEVAWTPTGAKLTLSLDLSRQFEIVLPPKGVDDDGRHTLKRGYGLEVTLATSNEKGIAIDYVGGRIDQAKLFGGKLFVKDLFLSYSADKGVLSGGASVELFRGPLAKYALPTVSASLGLQLDPFDFAKFEASVENINKPIGPYVFLQKVGGLVSKLPPPWAVEGTTELTLGPKFDIPLIGNVSAVSVGGTAKWQYPATISGAVDLKLFNQETSNATIEANLLEPEAKLSATTSITLAGSGFEGSLDGWLARDALLLSGGAKVKIAGFDVTGGDAFVSSKGIGACARWIGPDYGWRLRWGDKLPKVMAKSCDFGDLSEVGKKSQVGGATSTQIGKGSRGELLQIVGTGGAPLGTVRGPDGTVVEVGADRGFVQTDKVASVPELATNSVYVVLANPAPGTWVVEPRPGSAPLAITGRAKAKPEAQVKPGKLRKSGGGYRLSYSVKRAKGEQVVFTERGPAGR
ncbi:MAG: hypothetical protein Q7T55_26465, partial [Solirubrobacteraceae bacterium]|nr:hypothetical protein [Solirubrobacteraceae bacterium]